MLLKPMQSCPVLGPRLHKPLTLNGTELMVSKKSDINNVTDSHNIKVLSKPEVNINW